ncbi:MAG: acetyl-CoA carboxylase, biotin carboxyl carrier protein [Candidatus Omnitrophica bacterium 4484_49]|nr:MAG: acetyl-CoA carboxylase, biotin carboxyl carrier protein [Candidatus Omnitrophica bacterium 4484_49]
MMDLEKIKQIIQLMNDENLVEVEIEEEGRRIKLRKKEEQPGRLISFTSQAATSQEVSPQSDAEEQGIAYIKSPMVGTFYRAPAPDAPPFVEVGDEVDVGQTVCIIEAMKLMNEIKSEVRGKVLEVLVENGSPVDYGDNLFKVKVS